MKIIVITDTLDLGNGGVGTCVYDLCKAFLKHGYEVLLVGVVKYDNTNDVLLTDLKKAKCELYDVSAPNRRAALSGIIGNVKKLKKLIKEWSNGEKTICNVHLKMGVLYGSLSSIGLSNIKCVETYHNTYHNYFLQCSVLRPIIKKYITVSKEAKTEMEKRFLIPKKKIVAIPNGVDRDGIRNSIDMINEERKTNSLTVVTVGRLSYEKNILMSILAMSEITDLDYIYYVIGDGPQMEKAMQFVGGQNKRIRLLGKVERKKVFEYLSSADVVIMPSLWEGRSILMLEAAAFDVPFILSDCPGLREPFGEQRLDDNELYRETNFGYLVKTNEKEAYKNAVYAFANRMDHIEEMRTSVRSMSVRNDIRSVANEYITTFKTVLKL